MKVCINEKSDILKIVEIFYSIQGEGSQVGIPCIFIRFYGCNLACSFCDEKLHKGTYEELGYEVLLQKIEIYPSKYIVLTGGEPSLYVLNPLIKTLQDKGYFVAVETNGYCFENISQANWITYSPKDWRNIAIKGYSEVKFIVNQHSPIDKIKAFEHEKPLFIQPQNEQEKPDLANLAFCIDFVKKNPRFILSVQLHKFLGVE